MMLVPINHQVLYSLTVRYRHICNIFLFNISNDQHESCWILADNELSRCNAAKVLQIITTANLTFVRATYTWSNTAPHR